MFKNKKSQIYFGFPIDIIILYILQAICIWVQAVVKTSTIITIITWIIALVILVLFIMQFGLIGLLWWLLVQFLFGVIFIVFALIIVETPTIVTSGL